MARDVSVRVVCMGCAWGGGVLGNVRPKDGVWGGGEVKGWIKTTGLCLYLYSGGCVGEGSGAGIKFR